MGRVAVRRRARLIGGVLGAAAICLSACAAPAAPVLPSPTAPQPSTRAPLPSPPPASFATPLPTRTIFGPGERLPYTTQTGDYLEALAAHFNTSVAEILAANPGLPVTTTLPVGLELHIPAYYFPLGGSPFKIIPDSEFVYGPAQKDFDLRAFIASQPGAIRSYSAFVNQKQRDAAGTLEYVARQYSINPKLLLALMEWRTGALSRPEPQPRPFGALPDGAARDWYLQAIWVAEQLSLGYYGWRTGQLLHIPLPDSYRVRVDAYQNAGTVAVQYLIAQLVPREAFAAAAGPEGFAATYRALWGEVWEDPPEVLTGGLTQPALTLPFEPRRIWTFTGGPHAAWGELVPWRPWTSRRPASPAARTRPSWRGRPRPASSSAAAIPPWCWTWTATATKAPAGSCFTFISPRPTWRRWGRA